MTKKIHLCSLMLAIAAFGAGCGDDSGPTTTTDTDMGTTSPPPTRWIWAMTPAPWTTARPPATSRSPARSTRTPRGSCPSYLLTELIYVTGNSTLTIEPGVEIFGENDSALIVTRGSQLNAVGTAAEPIVFTSGNAVGTRNTSDWSGVALLGSAQLNSGTLNNGVLEGRIEGLEATEARAIYGGNDNASSCGHLEYVRIEFAGAELSPGNELNGLTLGGCGSGTELRYIQVHLGSDDGIEFFGGSAGMDHIVVSGASDDSLDWDLGWTGDVQFLVAHQFANLGDRLIEADNLGSNEVATPRSNPRIWNATFIGGTATNGILLREGTRGTFRNMIIMNVPGSPVDFAATTNDLSTEWPTQLSIERTFFFGNGAVLATGDTNDNMFDESAALMDAARNNVFGTDPMLGSTSATAPNYVPANTALNGQGTPPAGFDTTATYAGAFAVGGTNWAAGWTSYPAN
jgi:hypothetical protein